MAAKIKTNEYGDCIITEDDALEFLYTNPDFDISKLYFEDTDQYKKALDDIGVDLPKIKSIPKRDVTVAEFDKKNYANWHMPKSYYDLDMKKYLLEKCQTKEETARVEKEYELFEKKNFIKVLQFLVYFVDTMRKHNIVWGVGRGSSVASFCLFLIGIHKINPLMYKIDYREFLR